jgi:hypothetical protein
MQGTYINSPGKPFFPRSVPPHAAALQHHDLQFSLDINNGKGSKTRINEATVGTLGQSHKNKTGRRKRLVRLIYNQLIHETTVTRAKGQTQWSSANSMYMYVRLK